MAVMKLEVKVAQSLIIQQKTLAIAESCTGGLVCHRLTNVPGSSNFLLNGIITYSNEAKSKWLKIPALSIKKYGAVSDEIATAMAKNIRQLSKSDIGIGISGIAGPGGGSKSKPIGLVYISISTQLECICLKCQFTGNREEIKNKAVKQTFELLLEIL